MKILENVPMSQYTTFKLGGKATYFCAVKNEDELLEAVLFSRDHRLPFIVIGGGSNIIFPDFGYSGLVIKMEIEGIERDHDVGSGDVFISAGAGQNWETLVEYTVNNGLYGLETLSSIPGTVGASPVQNVGAYGVDVSGTIHSVRVLDTEKMAFSNLSNSDCAFTYRDSMFKHDKGHYIVTKVVFELSKNGHVNTSYKDIKEYFDKKGITNPSIGEVRRAVMEIRRDKLPDWTYWGTAGSFFKNPIIGIEKFEELKKEYPGLPGFVEPDGRVKVSLGWILDKVCDAKGLTIGNVGTYDRQALVIVAKPGAKATEVMEFSKELIRRVREKTGIEIEAEVEWAVA